ncbi:hypothetical protein IQE94_10030 [Synechocystis sp. PCC 7339]|uniref:hypothetical protein n=1 Tax=Synechocystis sp. PCC 7339 TaxID=2782213 RepID=UPI001CBA8F2D|nr:hypothetical protein [Synechocystis sp. PCC 7339]UAJ71508.1 hypothetical protein IQE94_10030 [Synechocystis sp. PCC 7339]
MEGVKLGLLSIRESNNSILFKIFNKVTEKTILVPINKCRHYCGFKYASNSLNPYENYIFGLHQKIPKDVLRKKFQDFLIFYRPQSFGDLLNIKTSRHIPLWIYPWHKTTVFDPQNGWIQDINNVPDIITHFCEKGIKKSKIEQEFLWLENAYQSISKHGYQPKNHSFIQVFEIRKDNQNVFIVKDGNHRLSALSALGQKNVLVKKSLLESVDTKNIEGWEQIKAGNYTKQDAILLCDSYINGVNTVKPSFKPAQLLNC